MDSVDEPGWWGDAWRCAGDGVKWTMAIARGTWTWTWAVLRRRPHDSWAQQCLRECTKENVLLVKGLQALASTSGRAWLHDWTDAVPWDDDDIDREALRRVADRTGAVVSPTPMHAGMVALVFAANGNDEAWVVKVKRRNIERRLRHAADQIERWTRVLSAGLDTTWRRMCRELVRHNVATLVAQADLAAEATHLSRAATLCRRLEYARVPQLRYQDVHGTALAMTRLPGMSVELLPEAARPAFAALAVRFGVTTALVHGFAHADFHRGNVLFWVDPDDHGAPHKLCVVDWGLVHHVSPRVRHAVLCMLEQLHQCQPDQLAVTLFSSGLLEPADLLARMSREERENLLAETSKLLPSARPVQLMQLVQNVNELVKHPTMRRWDVRCSPAALQAQLVLSMAHGLTSQLCGDEYLRIAHDTIRALLAPLSHDHDHDHDQREP